jgi:hypothetical protein
MMLKSFHYDRDIMSATYTREEIVMNAAIGLGLGISQSMKYRGIFHIYDDDKFTGLVDIKEGEIWKGAGITRSNLRQLVNLLCVVNRNSSYEWLQCYDLYGGD